MKKSILFLLLIVASFTTQAQDSISVLFIGNSYTYVNDLPSVLRDLSASMNKEVTIGSKVNGGYTFQNHVNDPATYTAIQQRPWDVVVIQGQSQEPSFPTNQVNTTSYPSAMRLADSVLANHACSNVMYFMTWGRQTGDPQWDSINTFDKMNSRLYAAYRRFADSADAMVAAVGAAWKYVRDNHPTINLYSSDGSHPSLEGTYLAATTFYASLFRESPVGATYLAGLNPTIASQLQAAAAAVVLDSLDHFFIRPVDSPTQAGFSLTQTGASINVTSASIHATNLVWDFGDGSSANGVSVAHTFTQNGTYTVELIASSTCNADTATISVLIATLGLSERDHELVEILSTDTYFEIGAMENVTTSVYDLQGVLVQHQMLKAGESLTLLRDRQVYILMVETGDVKKIYKLF